MGFKFERLENDDRSFEVMDWDRMISVHDVCRIYNVSLRTLRRRIKAGVFTDGVDAKQFENLWLFDSHKCDQLFEKKEEE